MQACATGGKGVKTGTIPWKKALQFNGAPVAHWIVRLPPRPPQCALSLGAANGVGRSDLSPARLLSHVSIGIEGVECTVDSTNDYLVARHYWRRNKTVQERPRQLWHAPLPQDSS